MSLINSPLLKPDYINKVLNNVMSGDSIDAISVAAATKLSSGLKWQPPIESQAHLPLIAEEGDAYHCTSDGTAYVFTDNKWVKLMGVGEEENKLDRVLRIMGEGDDAVER